MSKKVTQDYDNTLVGQYIRAIENPDSIGFNNGIWYKSPRRGDDPNNRGFGVDVEYNKIAAALTEGRKGKWLTEQEERDLRNKHIDYSLGIVNKWTPQVLYPSVSDTKKAIAAGLIYRGDGIKSILKNPEMKKAYFYGSDKDFQNTTSDFYKRKKLSERARNHNSFMEDYMKSQEATSDYYNFKDVPEPYVPTYSEGGELKKTKTWDELSMAEKSEMMKIAVDNGITNLTDIKTRYNEFAEGGKIRIKPENRGKFTALKKRTGHSATWFKEHGTPAQKKMAIFALNSRHWKHGLGGNLFQDGGDTDYVADYDDTYGARYGTLPEVVVTPKGIPNVIRPKVDEKQWQKHWGDEGAASVSRGMNQVAPYVASVLSSPFLIQDAISAPLGFVGGIAGGTAGGYVGGKVGDFIGKDLLGSTSNIGEEIGQTLGAIPGGTLGYGLLLKPQRSIGRVYNATHPKKIADGSDINPSLTFGERAVYDITGHFKKTAEALKDGRYIHDFKSLRRNVERATRARNLGFESTDKIYQEITGFPFQNVKRKTKYIRDVSNYYDPPTNKIAITLTDNKNTNIARENYKYTWAGGHEKTHANNHLLNTLFGTPTLGVKNKYTGYYSPNIKHPIAKKYYSNFTSATTPHGMLPEESWANLMGHTAAYDNPKADEFLRWNAEHEGVDVPIEFFTDYAKYLEDTYKPLSAKFFNK